MALVFRVGLITLSKCSQQQRLVGLAVRTFTVSATQNTRYFFYLPGNTTIVYLSTLTIELF